MKKILMALTVGLIAVASLNGYARGCGPCGPGGGFCGPGGMRGPGGCGPCGPGGGWCRPCPPPPCRPCGGGGGAFWGGFVGGLVGGAVANSGYYNRPYYNTICSPSYGWTGGYGAPVVVNAAAPVVATAPTYYPATTTVVTQPSYSYAPTTVITQPTPVYNQMIVQPAPVYGGTTVVQPAYQREPLIGAGVNVLGLKVGVGVGY